MAPQNSQMTGKADEARLVDPQVVNTVSEHDREARVLSRRSINSSRNGLAGRQSEVRNRVSEAWCLLAVFPFHQQKKTHRGHSLLNGRVEKASHCQHQYP